MKLYFYTLNTDERYRKTGITAQVCEAEEKPKTYAPINDSIFPNYISRLRKVDIGHFISYNSNVVAFTEPSFEHAKEMFKDREKARIEKAKMELDKLENELKVIEESEE